MKQRFFIMAAAALTLAACSNDENMEMTDGPVAARITAGLSAPTTRAIGTNWSGTEEIGVFVTNSTSGMDDLYKNVKYQNIFPRRRRNCDIRRIRSLSGK